MELLVTSLIWRATCISGGRKFETGQTLSYLQTDTTTPNIVGPTTLGVVASIYT